MQISISKIQSILNATQSHLTTPNTIISHLVTDSRTLTFPQSTLFFALISEVRDGHQFIDELYRKGTRNFIVSESEFLTRYPDVNIIQVQDTLRALQVLVASEREKYTLPVIGITGSNGKTIVKEWLNQLLGKNFNILRSPRSYNSQIGVPLSVWELNDTYNLAIFEAGISKPGEMDKLENIIQPTIGILTNIGAAHEENFESRAQKIREKLLLFKHSGVVLLPHDDQELLSIAKEKLSCPIITWGKEKGADLWIKEIKISDNNSTIHAVWHSQEQEITIPFSDEASILNAITAWSLMLYLHIDTDTIQKQFLLLRPLDMRLQIIAANNQCTVINDSYSFDVNSLGIALDVLSQQALPKTVIISDLAYNDYESYKSVALLLRNKNIHRVIAIGSHWQEYQDLLNTEIKETAYFSSLDTFIQQFNTIKFHKEAILLKGARKYRFERIIPLLEARVHQTHLEINLNAMANNLKYYRSYLKPGTKIVAMVKASGYGSGSIEVSTLMQFYKVDYLAVAYADEGVALRNAGISLPIMVMNVDEYTFDTLVSYHLEPNIYSFKIFHAFDAYLRRQGITNYPVHFKIDTGMHRLGFEEEEIRDIAHEFKGTNSMIIQSAFSHFVASEDPNEDAFTRHQAEMFIRCTDLLKKIIGYTFIRHIANTSGILRFPEYHLDMVRLGIGLYGVDSSSLHQDKIETVNTLLTTIAQIHHIKAGDTIGYNRRGKVDRDSKIATIRIGYADGLNRKLGYSNGEVFLHGKRAPILGSICMDMCMVDITDIPDVKEGETVEIFGPNIPVQELADKIGTISYEIFTGIGERIPRVYIEE